MLNQVDLPLARQSRTLPTHRQLELDVNQLRLLLALGRKARQSYLW